MQTGMADEKGVREYTAPGPSCVGRGPGKPAIASMK